MGSSDPLAGVILRRRAWLSPSSSKRSFRRLRLGYEIVAIDPQALGGAIFERISLEEFTDSGPFDAVLANSAR